MTNPVNVRGQRTSLDRHITYIPVVLRTKSISASSLPMVSTPRK